MNILRSQSQAPVHRDGFGQEKPNEGLRQGVLSATRGSFSSNLSLSEWQTLHEENKTSGGQDPEKDVMELAGKYAKYAGEPPDGGFKAWSVVLAYVGYRCLHSVPGTDRGPHAGPA